MGLLASMPLSFPTELTWKGWVVCGLLVFSRLLLVKYPSLPPDVVYSLAALATTLIGALSSGEIRVAATNPLIWALLVVFPLRALIGSRFREVSLARLASSIPWSMILLVFSAYLFYFALERTGFSTWIAQSIPVTQALFPAIPLVVLFSAAWICGIIFPVPLACALVFSIATALLRQEPFSLIAALFCIGSGAGIHLLKKFEIIKRFGKWKSQVGTRFGSF